MSRTRIVLATALLAGGIAAPAAFAAGDPRCNNPVASGVHEVEEAAATTPAGAVTTPVIHNVVEPAVCKL